MTRRYCLTVSAIALAALTTPAYAQETNPLTDVIVVTGQRLFTGTATLDPGEEPAAGPDAAALAARLPGAALIDNGGLSGQVQYRGLFGPRLNIRVDGQRFASGGPNLMDPPLHYAPMPLVAAIELDRGVSPVSEGPGLAGGLNAVLKSSDFTSGPAFTPHWDVMAGGNTADESWMAGGLAALSNDTLRFHLLASREEGGDLSFPGGVIGGTEHERSVRGIGAGARIGSHEFFLDARRQETGLTGNPPFAMDIRYFNTDIARAGWRGRFGETEVSLTLSGADVDHAMNNFTLRPAPANMMMWRETFASSESRTLDLRVSHPLAGGTMSAGVDRTEDTHDVRITNPNNANFFLHTVNGTEMNRTGVFAEWEGPALGWTIEAGLRADWHEAVAGLSSVGPAVPAMPGMLAAAFNAGLRDLDDTTVDAALRAWRPLNDAVTWRVTLARKTRAPGYIERFAWLPTEASSGLADGNVYVGDRSLSPESAWIIETGFDIAGDNFYLRPTVFYRQVDDYIQGVPFDATVGVIDTPVEMVASMNGDPTPLRFANVDARLYGVDFDFGYRLSPVWRIDGVASLVRGERRDIDDNLYRVTPPSLSLAVTREARDWFIAAEGIAVAQQDDVSLTNSEALTQGYGLLNLHAGWDVSDQVRLAANVTNLLDAEYEEHLAGYNRNASGDVGVGQRLPGAGRGFGLRLSWRR